MSRGHVLRLTAWKTGRGEGYSEGDLYLVRRVVRDETEGRDYLLAEIRTTASNRPRNFVLTTRQGLEWDIPRHGDVEYLDGWDVTGDLRYEGEAARGPLPPAGFPSLYTAEDCGPDPRAPEIVREVFEQTGEPPSILRLPGGRRMNPDDVVLFQALGSGRPVSIAAALRSGTVLIRSDITPEGEEDAIVRVDASGRRLLLAFSCRTTLSQHALEEGSDGRYQMVLGVDLPEVVRRREVDEVIFDITVSRGMTMTPAELRSALDRAAADAAGTPDDLELAAALPGRDVQAILSALSTGTIIVPVDPPGAGGAVARFTSPGGHTDVYAFSTHGTFVSWAEAMGHTGHHRVLDGAGLGALVQGLGVGGVILDAGAPHAMRLTAPSLILASPRGGGSARERKGLFRRRER